MEYNISDRISSLKPSAIREILKATSEKNVISFAAGNPSPDAFPIEDVRSLTQEILKDEPVTALQYGVTEGYKPLIETVKKIMKDELGVGGEDDGVIITSGAQQVIDLTSKVLLNEDDVVISESPSFIGALNTFRSYKGRLVGVDIEDDGINTEKLEYALKHEPRAKFIYTIPNFQNPTGVTMSYEKRKEVYRLAKKYGVIILEDNPYGDLRLSGKDIPAIKTLDDEGIVIYSGSFSKILSPGLRVAFTVAPKELISRMTVGKQASDVHTPMLTQMLVYRWLTTRDYKKHIQKIRDLYSEKLDLMCSSIDAELGSFVKYLRPCGGLFIWCSIQGGADMLTFCKKAADSGVAVVPGTAFMMYPEDKTSCFRLNFSTPTQKEIVDGMKILGKIKDSFV